MKKTRMFLTALLLAAAFPLLSAGPRHTDDGLWERFCHPADEARTKLWWFHGETVTTKAGIDADLAAFKEKGVGGVVFYDQVHGAAEGAFPAMSPEWWEMLKYAALRAKELGLSFEVAASNGYVAGGPWITPEFGMRKIAVVDTVIRLDRPRRLSVRLASDNADFRDIATLLVPERPEYCERVMSSGVLRLQDGEAAEIRYDAGRPVTVSAVSYTTNPRGKGSTGSMNIPGKPQERYFGAGFVELPPVGELEYSLDGQNWTAAAPLPAVENVLGHKSRERTVSFPEVRGRYFRVRLHDWMDAEGTFNVLEIGDVRLSPRDRIDNWQVKSGLRTEVSYPHPEGGDKGAFDPRELRDVSGQADADGRLTLTLGRGTWRILRFGHVPTGGRTKNGRRNLLGLEADVLSADAAKLHFDNYFGPICDTLEAIGCKPAGMCMDSHEAGIQNWTRGFERRFKALRGYDLVPWLPVLAGYVVGDRRQSEQVLLDFRKTIAETIASEYYGTFERLCRERGVSYTSQAMQNIEMDNIRNRGVVDKPQGEFWTYQTNGNYDCLDAASSAHLYGHPIASGEAFTDTPYDVSWDELLRIANLAYCRGINEFAVCASSYQPWADRKYDDSASAHPYVFHRLHPEWDSVGPFWEYQARCAQLLREGVPVVDLCVYLGEDLPIKTMAYKLPEMPEGCNFDVCTIDALMNRFSAEGGMLAVQGGMRYRALVVQDRTYLSPEALQKIEALAREGVPVIRCDLGGTVAAGLAEAGIAPDLGFKSAALPDDRLCFFHRSADGAEIYFIYNHSAAPYDASVTPRCGTGPGAEFWDPRTLGRKAAAVNADGSVRLRLAPYESTFLIIRP